MAGFLILAVAVIAGFILYPIVKTRYQPSVVTAPEAVSLTNEADALYCHVEALSVGIGPRSVADYESLNKARDYIIGQLRQWDYEPELHPFTYKKNEYYNVEASLKGKSAPDQVILIGAHYDTVERTPGADDNASSVAIVLETAHRLKEHHPERTLKFLFFSLEERPAFATRHMGSETYARAAREKGEDIRAMICLEMVGYFSEVKGGQSFPLPLMGLKYPRTPNFIGVVGNKASRDLLTRVEKSLKVACEVPVESLVALPYIPSVDFSDHRSFWRTGYKAVMITDTAFYRNPNYHTYRDTIDTLNFVKMGSLLKGILRCAQDLSAAEK